MQKYKCTRSWKRFTKGDVVEHYEYKRIPHELKKFFELVTASRWVDDLVMDNRPIVVTDNILLPKIVESTPIVDTKLDDVNDSFSIGLTTSEIQSNLMDDATGEFEDKLRKTFKKSLKNHGGI